MAVKGLFSYWYLPIISGLVWLGMLLGMILWWAVDKDSKRLLDMDADQHVPYISDIGALKLKPLFIAGSAVTTVFLDLSFFAERLLRHRGRLVPNMSRGETTLAVISILFAIAGTAGLILLSIFDTYRHPNLHDGFLLLFLAGYLLSAVFICWEYQRLGIKHREHRVLRVSFWLKLTFILVELVLAIVFVATNFTNQTDIAAGFEWAVAFIFTFYILSFYYDLRPAVYTKSDKFSKAAMADTTDGSNFSSQRPAHF